MKKKPDFKPANYRKMFYLGIACLVIGVPFGSIILIAFGTFLMILGWLNKHKWPSQPPKESAAPSEPEEKPEESSDEDYDR